MFFNSTQRIGHYEILLSTNESMISSNLRASEREVK